jgi:ribosomal protein L44E
MIYCKNFCKCHNEPPVQQYNKKKKRETTENKEITAKKRIKNMEVHREPKGFTRNMNNLQFEMCCTLTYT